MALGASSEFPVAFFSQTDKVYGFGSPCFYHRKRTRMPVAELKKIQLRLNIFRFHVTRLIRAVEIETENKFIRLDVDRAWWSRDGCSASSTAMGHPDGAGSERCQRGRSILRDSVRYAIWYLEAWMPLVKLLPDARH